MFVVIAAHCFYSLLSLSIARCRLVHVIVFFLLGRYTSYVFLGFSLMSVLIILGMDTRSPICSFKKKGVEDGRVREYFFLCSSVL